MNKTVHKDFIKNTLTSYLPTGSEKKIYVAGATHLMNEYLSDAANDLLQPRAEAVAQLLKKARNTN